MTATNSKGSSPEPGVAFQRVPRANEAPPTAPGEISAAPAGAGAVALTWGEPGSGTTDFSQVA